LATKYGQSLHSVNDKLAAKKLSKLHVALSDNKLSANRVSVVTAYVRRFCKTQADGIDFIINLRVSLMPTWLCYQFAY